MKKVTVTADKKTGQAIAQSGSPNFGYVRVEQLRSIVDDNGWLKNVSVAALILGKLSDLKEAGYTAGQELEGRIQIKEQLTPFNKKDPTKDQKIAGKTGIVCMVDDQPIYRKAFYSQDAEAKDVLIAHTNVEAIKAAYAKQIAQEADATLSLED